MTFARRSPSAARRPSLRSVSVGYTEHTLGPPQYQAARGADEVDFEGALGLSRRESAGVGEAVADIGDY